MPRCMFLLELAATAICSIITAGALIWLLAILAGIVTGIVDIGG
jgi:hypothetical protein